MARGGAQFPARARGVFGSVGGVGRRPLFPLDSRNCRSHRGGLPQYLPYVARLPATAATPSIREVDIPTTFSKLITPNLGVTFTETYRILEQPNAPTRTGFDNLSLGTQYHLYVNSQHEFIFTIGGTAVIGGEHRAVGLCARI